MGAVTIDVHKKEREYQHLTLSDVNVVKYLILFRASVDASYGASVNVNIEQAGDLFEFNQELICLYASLDAVLNKLALKEREDKLLKLVFDGNSIADIINDYGYPKKTAYRILNRIVDKVVEENFSDWKKVAKLKVERDSQGIS